MDFAGPDPGWLLLAGHLAYHEQSRLRKYLLYLLVRYVELPFLKSGYKATRGEWRFIAEKPLLRLLAKTFILHPIGARIDTGHPMLTDDVINLIDSQETDIAVGPCRCRMAHGQCNHRLETDIVIRTGTGAFTKAFPKDYRRITKEEAKDLVRICADEGMWHMVFVHCHTAQGVNEYAVCNCCQDGCVPFLLNKEFGQDGFPLLRGEYVAQTNPSACKGCGKCLDICPWDARTLVDGVIAVDTDLCFGCGLCARVCENEGVSMIKQRPQPALRTYQ